MPEPPTLKRRFLGLCATSLTALCLPILDYQLNQSRTIHAHGDYVIYLICTVLFAILWPLSTTRSLARLHLNRSWILVVVLPYGLASIAVATLILFGLWSIAYTLTNIASLAMQVILIPVYLLPHGHSISTNTGSSPA
jgi:hypothetical protein